jgi:hypothetical protein
MKLLILEACAIAAVGAEASSHADVGDVVDVPKDDAVSLARMGRAMFLDKADDPTKGLLTATDADRTQVKRRAAAIEKERAARAATAAAQSPVGMAEMIATAVAGAVATAVQAALSGQAAAQGNPGTSAT